MNLIGQRGPLGAREAWGFEDKRDAGRADGVQWRVVPERGRAGTPESRARKFLRGHFLSLSCGHGGSKVGLGYKSTTRLIEIHCSEVVCMTGAIPSYSPPRTNI